MKPAHVKPLWKSAVLLFRVDHRPTPRRLHGLAHRRILITCCLLLLAFSAAFILLNGHTRITSLPDIVFMDETVNIKAMRSSNTLGGNAWISQDGARVNFYPENEWFVKERVPNQDMELVRVGSKLEVSGQSEWETRDRPLAVYRTYSYDRETGVISDPSEAAATDKDANAISMDNVKGWPIAQAGSEDGRTRAKLMRDEFDMPRFPSGPSQYHLYLRTPRDNTVRSVAMPASVDGKTKSKETETMSAPNRPLLISDDGNVLCFTVDKLSKNGNMSKQWSEIALYNDSTKRFAFLPADSGKERKTILAAMSANGRYVVYLSRAVGKVDYPQIIRYDIKTGRRKQVSGREYDCNLTPQVAISGDGRYIVFAARKRNMESSASVIYLYDAKSAAITPLSEDANSFSQEQNLPITHCRQPSISRDGRYICYTALISNYDAEHTETPAPERRRKWAALIYDREKQQTSMVLSVKGWPYIAPDPSVPLRDNPELLREKYLEIRAIEQNPSKENIARLYREIYPLFRETLYGSPLFFDTVIPSEKEYDPATYADLMIHDYGAYWLVDEGKTKCRNLFRAYPQYITSLLKADLRGNATKQQKALAVIASASITTCTEELLALFSKSRDEEIIRKCAQALRATGDLRAIPALMKKYPSDPVRFSAELRSLCRNRPADPALEKKLNSPDASIRKKAAYALAESGDPTLAPTIIALMQYDDDGMYQNAIDMAYHQPDAMFAKIRPHLVSLLDHPDDEVVIATARLLAHRTKDPVCGPALLRILRKNEKGETMRQAILVAEELTGKKYGFALTQEGRLEDSPENRKALADFTATLSKGDKASTAPKSH